MAKQCHLQPPCDRKKHSAVWCKPMVCSIEGCGKPTGAGKGAAGLCSTHYARKQFYGDPLAELQRQPNVGACTVDGCDQPMRKRSWCASHYANWQRTGQDPEPFKYKWADRQPCKVCGKSEWHTQRRDICSAKCQQIWQRSKGQFQKVATCKRCDREYDLFEVREGRERKKRADSSTCSDCRRLTRLTKFVNKLRQRDGDDCHLCDSPIDFSLAHPDPMSRSVDHIVPWSKGGSDAIENLALAHLRCNSRRRDEELSVWKLVV